MDKEDWIGNTIDSRIGAKGTDVRKVKDEYYWNNSVDYIKGRILEQITWGKDKRTKGMQLQCICSY